MGLLLMFHHDPGKLPSLCQRLVFIKLPRLIRNFRQIVTVQTNQLNFFHAWSIIYDCEDIALI